MRISASQSVFKPSKVGGPGNQKGHSQDCRAAGWPRNLDQTLIETAVDIGRLNSVKFQLKREVEELQKKVDHYDAILFERG